MSGKIEKNEFIELCKELSIGLGQKGFPCHLSHDKEVTWFSFHPMNGGMPMFVYNSARGLIWGMNFDFRVRTKECGLVQLVN